MFNPTREQVRRFYLDAWMKHQTGGVMTPLEALAANIMAMHPEYHALFETGEATLEREWTPEMGESNPFLHISLHMAIEEQLSIDQPTGLRAAFDQQLARLGDRHDALHVVLDCLAEALWHAQRAGAPIDGVAYVSAVKAAR
ncbi:MAG: hypothetical protein RIR70_2058 [Pseudomonadota bacterium]|jgi:hypothetical protein